MNGSLDRFVWRPGDITVVGGEEGTAAPSSSSSLGSDREGANAVTAAEMGRTTSS